MIERKPAKCSGNSRERTNRNDPDLFVCDVDRSRTSAGQSLMAVDLVRHLGRIIDADFAKEPRAGSLLALAGGVGEILDSFFVARPPWEPLSMVTLLGRGEI